ncbi:MAG TPA: NUMOD3 domain-containing DNA-binding protein [Nitrososphaerales archaeon]|nr:NUMOD3 domain-containing DNA-binding protein [Nitrososphaerales archaeon]
MAKTVLTSETIIIRWCQVTRKTRDKISMANMGERHHPATEFKKGNRPWNFGLTKESDPRVASYADKKKKTSRVAT